MKEERRKERDEAHLYITVRVVTPTSFRNHSGTELAAWDLQSGSNAAAPESFKILKSSNLSQVVSTVAEELKLNPKLIRFWAMVNRQNKTVRPESLLTNYELAADALFGQSTAVREGLARLWLEVAHEVNDDGDPVWPSRQTQANNPVIVNDDQILLFLKHFDVEAQTLRGVGHFYLHKEKKIEDILPTIMDKMGWGESLPADEKLLLWEVS